MTPVTVKPVIESGDDVLAKIDRASLFLAEAKSLQEVNSVIAMAAGATVYAKRVHASQETINMAAEIHLRAERKLGEILQQTPKSTGGDRAGRMRLGGARKEPANRAATLKEIGIGKKLSSRAQALANVPEPEFEQSIAKAREAEISPARVRTDLSREVRREKKATDRADAAREADKLELPDDCGVQLGDFREIVKSLEDNSVDLIFTDPPYDRKTLPLYGDVAREAARILKPGGSFICYLGQYQIHDVCQLVAPHLRLWWTLACLHTGQSARMTEYGIVVKWKPMLWFVKGTRGDKQTFVDDLIESKQEKSAHDWQQSEIEASYYIDKLTMPGGFVFDPFCGGGTTAVAATKLKRRWLTCDVDEVAVKLARKRIHDATV